MHDPPRLACARKNIFRATAGLSLDEQLQVAAQLQSGSDNVLQVSNVGYTFVHTHSLTGWRTGAVIAEQKIEQLKKTSKQQKQITKSNSLKVSESLVYHSIGTHRQPMTDIGRFCLKVRVAARTWPPQAAPRGLKSNRLVLWRSED